RKHAGVGEPGVVAELGPEAEVTLDQEVDGGAEVELGQPGGLAHLGAGAAETGVTGVVVAAGLAAGALGAATTRGGDAEASDADFDEREEAAEVEGEHGAAARAGDVDGATRGDLDDVVALLAADLVDGVARVGAV